MDADSPNGSKLVVIVVVVGRLPAHPVRLREVARADALPRVCPVHHGLVRVDEALIGELVRDALNATKQSRGAGART
jgi:hypothetical protein